VVVLDHHLAGETLPAAHGRREPQPAGRRRQPAHLCAAGVVFLMLVEANRQLRAAAPRGPT
jgi:single-stranded-DNA-specific exonuclease